MNKNTSRDKKLYLATKISKTTKERKRLRGLSCKYNPCCKADGVKNSHCVDRKRTLFRVSSMKKKAQLEIVGLVVIVLILSIAMMFYLSYASNDTQSSKKSIYTTYSHNELAVSFLSALSHTSVCDDVTVEDLVTDCGIRNRIICPGTKTSCEQLEEIIVTIKNETLDTWDFAYGLTINFTTSREAMQYVRYNCTRETVGRGSPGLFPMAYYPTPGDALVELGICS